MVGDRLRSHLLAHSRWRHARWLVIAPHADDETLGCGALIDEAARAGRLGAVAYLTDGAGSHSCATDLDKRRLISLRRQEARAAMRILAPRLPPPLFLAWPDANPFPLASQARAATVARLAGFCRTESVDAIAVTGRDEPHCDHVAAFEVAQVVSEVAGRPITVFEYVVWAKQAPGPEFAVVRTAAMTIGRRKLALAQHRSQLTPTYGDGFRVPMPMRRSPSFDLLYTRVMR